MDPRPINVEALAGALLHPATLAALARADRGTVRGCAAALRATASEIDEDGTGVLRALADALEAATE